ncbi:MAG: hypothetical protein FJX31_01110 [Alphaproteobacteria bacterium]|nr:hypothetical protein [Alphaproteobacteria bacterium]
MRAPFLNLIASLAPSDIDAHALQKTLAKADLTAATLRIGSGVAKHQIITQILSKAILHDDRVELVMSDAGLADVLTIERSPLSTPNMLSVAATRLRRGHQIRLVIEGEGRFRRRRSNHHLQRRHNAMRSWSRCWPMLVPRVSWCLPIAISRLPILLNSRASAASISQSSSSYPVSRRILSRRRLEANSQAL